MANECSALLKEITWKNIKYGMIVPDDSENCLEEMYKEESKS